MGLDFSYKTFAATMRVKGKFKLLVLEDNKTKLCSCFRFYKKLISIEVNPNKQLCDIKFTLLQHVPH